MISVVIPTIPGRENLFDQTVEALEATANGTRLQFIVPRGHKTCGEGWNAGAELADGDYLMLAADDMIPHDGWLEAAVMAADEGVYPAPWIVNPDGSTLCCGTLGSGLLLSGDARDGLPVCNSPVPFMCRDRWPEIGPSIPTHCYSDDYLAFRARIAGLSVEVRRAFKFTHLDGQHGHMPLVLRAGVDRELYAREASKL
jgi:glycosyltransferase involved in cell wall biosynthesis